MEPTSILTIDLDALAGNYRRLQARAQAGTAVAGVVKADAYGLGAQHIVPVLDHLGCPFYFVANFDEAVAIRPLTQNPIAILCGPQAASDVDLCRANGFWAVLNSHEQIERMARLAPDLPCLLHLDTGMNRLGLSEDELTDLIDTKPDVLRTLSLRFAMTHFACADEKDSPVTRAQLHRYQAMKSRLECALCRPIPDSLANSSALFGPSDLQGQMVRPGMALYGLNPTPESANPMAPVVTWSARLLQIRTAKAGETVGYGATYTLRRKSRLATLAVGYADGALRALSNRGTVFWQDTPCPILGRVSMDLITVDLTDLPPHPAPQVGDLMDLICPSGDADALAKQAGTIGYEILTGLSHRATRVYLPLTP